MLFSPCEIFVKKKKKKFKTGLITPFILLLTVDWGRKWLVDFSFRKNRLVSFDQSSNTVAIDVKMSVLEEKPSFKMLELTFSSKLDWDSYIISSAKTISKKIVLYVYKFYEVSFS